MYTIISTDEFVYIRADYRRSIGRILQSHSVMKTIQIVIFRLLKNVFFLLNCAPTQIVRNPWMAAAACTIPAAFRTLPTIWAINICNRTHRYQVVSRMYFSRYYFTCVILLVCMDGVRPNDEGEELTVFSYTFVHVRADGISTLEHIYGTLHRINWNRSSMPACLCVYVCMCVCVIAYIWLDFFDFMYKFKKIHIVVR